MGRLEKLKRQAMLDANISLLKEQMDDSHGELDFCAELEELCAKYNMSCDCNEVLKVIGDVDIEDNPLGLAFINDLKPKKYKKLHPADWDEAIREKRYEDGTRDEFDDKKVWDGLIAQEVKEAIEKSGTSFSGWSVDANGKQGIQYSALVIPLINAVQELSKEVERLKNEL